MYNTTISTSLDNFINEDMLYTAPKTIKEWEEEWNFKEYNANIYNHGLHQYPARFMPQLARKILKTFTSKNSSVLDIFSGSGTTLLECKYLNINQAYGIELNPFANFIAKVKLQNVSETEIVSWFDFIKNEFFDKQYIFPIISFKHIDFWYSYKVIFLLSKLYNILLHIRDENVKDFFLLCFCNITRKLSYLNHNGFKMHRSKDKILFFDPDVWAEFDKVVNKNFLLLKKHNNIIKNNTSVQTIIEGDSRNIHLEIPQNSIDLILTSPPYGDSKTTVAYGQYSRLPYQWIYQNNEILNLDNLLLGGNQKNIDETILNYSKTFQKQLQTLKEVAPSHRINDVISFYNDLYDSLISATYYLKKNGFFILVTGNRIVSNVYLRTDLILSEFAKSLGYSIENTYCRNISNKRMALKNSPSNEKGKKTNTMMTEHIIILKK